MLRSTKSHRSNITLGNFIFEQAISLIFDILNVTDQIRILDVPDNL